MCHFRLKNITDNTYEIKHSVYWIYIRLPGASNLIQNFVFTNVALNIKAAFAMLSHYQSSRYQKNGKICFQQYSMPSGCNPLPSIFANTLPQDVFICVWKCCLLNSAMSEMILCIEYLIFMLSFLSHFKNITV